MHLNIAHKIFGIAIVVLALMAAVAIYSVQLTANISEELDAVAGRQLPLSDTIGRINVKILEKGLLLQQLFALPHTSARSKKRIKQLAKDINADFIKARALFSAEERSAHPASTIFALHKSLDKVEVEYRDLTKHSLELLALHERDDQSAFLALLPDLNKQQDTIDAEIATLRRHVETVADEAVKRADEEEKFLLYFNAAMTTLSAILGLGFAAIVTFVLVRNVRNLVRGAEAVEEGNLDTEVPIITKDEVGKLSASFNEMVGGLRMKERIKDTFGKYMDPRIVNQLLENPEFTQLGGDRREMTVMFIDLKGYTTISEQLKPVDLVHMLNIFLGKMADAVSNTHGVVNDFLGDAVMAYWGPPFTKPEEHAELACKAGLEALENFDQFKSMVVAELGEKAKDLDLDLRIGISSGYMVAGNIGSPASKKYSVIGDPVNLGARLEGANKAYGTRVMISERTRELAGEHIHVRELDLIRVKGKTEPTRIYELLASAPSGDGLLAGLEAYRKQDWNFAEQAFNSYKEASPDDPVPLIFLERIAHLKANPPGTNWDGVWTFQTK